jgi:hypothetical protein
LLALLSEEKKKTFTGGPSVNVVEILIFNPQHHIPEAYGIKSNSALCVFMVT